MAKKKSLEHDRDSITPICAIGASAGGVSALRSFFRQVPSDLGIAYVVIMHLAPDQPSALSEILAGCTDMPVHQVSDGPKLKAGCIYVIPPDRQLVIEGDHVTAQEFSEPRGRRAPIDMFFRSVAHGRGDGLAVVLTGAGSDGAIGIQAIKEAGGVIFVQDPAEAEFPAMPQSAIATGVADFVAPISSLVDRIKEVSRSKEAVRSLDMDGAANELRRIVGYLRARTGHDFSSYKRATVMRRVLRRMQVRRMDNLTDYAEYLRTAPEEAQELFADLLISVTMFFRDPEAFELLRDKALVPLFDDIPEEGFRIWVVGCATGEEAYSVGILMLEEAARRKIHVPIQIFATDLDDGAMATAREGRYPQSIIADVSEERLKRYFVNEGTHYRVGKELRDCVLFANHSVLKDPPFMRLDLITCRNLLIYLERSLQDQVCSLFHYGLKTGRYLFLGSAETADAAAEEFAPVDREARLYRSRPRAAHSMPILPNLSRGANAELHTPHVSSRGHRPSAMPTEIHAAALEKLAPPSVLVDERHDIIHLSPTAGRFLLHSAGTFTPKLPSVVRPELRLDLKLALDRALETRTATLTHGVPVALNGTRHMVALHVAPVVIDDKPPSQALVSFLDGGPYDPSQHDEPAPDGGSEDVRRLHAELKSAQEALVVSRNEHEAAIQDLRAANEELQSINEEYRSTSEELETSKEELQSMNEELQTVNGELKSKLESISSAHSDLQNLTAATEIGTLFLDTKLRIRMFTPPVVALFNITGNDIGRAITDFTHRLIYEDMEREVNNVLRNLTPVETEVETRDGRWYMMRLRPYRTVDDRINGTVLTFVDITDRVLAERNLRDSERRFKALVQATSQVLYRMSPEWQEMRQLVGGGFLKDTEKPSADWIEHYILGEDRARVQQEIVEAVKARRPFELEHRVRRADGSVGWTLSRAVPILDEGGEIEEWFGAATDVTDAKNAEQALLESEQRLRLALEVGGLGTIDWDVARDAMTWSEGFAQMHGLGAEAVTEGQSAWLEAILPEDRDGLEAALSMAKDEKSVFEHEYRTRRKDGSRHWCLVRGQFYYDDGRAVRMVGVGEDTTHQREWRDQQRIMVNELQHRTRNLLAVVHSIAQQTLKTSSNLDEYRTRFEARLSALSRVQGLLSHADVAPITLDMVIGAELDALGGYQREGKVTCEGPEIRLRSRVVQTFALALHELATNARKYGALSGETGSLSVKWHEEEQDGQPFIVLEWVETGMHLSPEQLTTSHAGYGRQMIEQALPYSVSARTSYELLDDGVRCTLAVPTARLVPSEKKP